MTTVTGGSEEDGRGTRGGDPNLHMAPTSMHVAFSPIAWPLAYAGQESNIALSLVHE